MKGGGCRRYISDSSCLLVFAVAFLTVTFAVLGTSDVYAQTLAVDPAPSVDEGEELRLRLVAGGVDDASSFTHSHDFAFGDIIGDEFVWTPTYDDAGEYTVTFALARQVVLDTLSWHDGVGEHTVMFTLQDPDATATAVSTITVNNVDRAPVISINGTEVGAMYNIILVAEGQTLTFVVTASDPDGTTVNLKNKNRLPEGSAFTGTFEWTPDFDDSRSQPYHVQFAAFNTDDLSPAAFNTDDLSPATTTTTTVPIRVTDTSSPPELIEGSFDTDEDTVLEITAAQIAQNADTGAMPAVIRVVTPPAIGTATIKDGVLSYDPRAGYNHLDAGEAANVEMTVRVSGGREETQVDSDVVIRVTGINDAPSLDIVGVTQVNGGETITLTLGVTDPDDDVFVYGKSIEGGQIDGNTFTWVTVLDDSGAYPVTFTVLDDNGASATAQVTLTITDTDIPEARTDQSVDTGTPSRDGNIADDSDNAVSNPDTERPAVEKPRVSGGGGGGGGGRSGGIGGQHTNNDIHISSVSWDCNSGTISVTAGPDSPGLSLSVRTTEYGIENALKSDHADGSGLATFAGVMASDESYIGLSLVLLEGDDLGTASQSISVDSCIGSRAFGTLDAVSEIPVAPGIDDSAADMVDDSRDGTGGTVYVVTGSDETDEPETDLFRDGYDVTKGSDASGADGAGSTVMEPELEMDPEPATDHGLGNESGGREETDPEPADVARQGDLNIFEMIGKWLESLFGGN